MDKNVKYKVGDWIYVIQNGVNNTNHQEYKINACVNSIIKIHHFSTSTYDGLNVAVSKEGHVLYIGQFPDKFRLATPEEIAKVTGEFVLPEKWCVKNIDDKIGRFYNKNTDTNNYYYDGSEYQYLASHSLSGGVSILDKNCGANFRLKAPTKEYSEITFDQFKQYVLKEPVEKEEEEVKSEWWKTLKKGDVVRCIANTLGLGNRKEGQEFTIYKDFDGKINYGKNYFSYKFDEFELVRRASEIEKWSVGSYVVFLSNKTKTNGGASITKYKPYRITHNSSDSKKLNYIDDDKGNNFNFFHSEEEIEWFATLEEAQKFSNELLGKVTVSIKAIPTTSKSWEYTWSATTENHHSINIFGKSEPKRIQIYVPSIQIKEVEPIIKLKIRSINKIKI